MLIRNHQIQHGRDLERRLEVALPF